MLHLRVKGAGVRTEVTWQILVRGLKLLSGSALEARRL